MSYCWLNYIMQSPFLPLNLNFLFLFYYDIHCAKSIHQTIVDRPRSSLATPLDEFRVNKLTWNMATQRPNLAQVLQKLLEAMPIPGCLCNASGKRNKILPTNNSGGLYSRTNSTASKEEWEVGKWSNRSKVVKGS